MTPNDAYADHRSNRWQDWANLILAIWLFISPWVLAYGATAAEAVGAESVLAANADAAAWNAWISGLIVAVVAIAAIVRVARWEEWINLLMGLWIFVAPWVLAFAALEAAAWNHWIVGLLVFALAVWDLVTIRRERRTTI